MDSTLTPHKLFKPCLFRSQFLYRLKYSEKTLYKRNYKYVHGLQIAARGKKLKELEMIPRFKYISSISRQLFGARNNLPLWQKFIKQHRKCLNNISNLPDNISIQKLLPQIPRLDLGLDPRALSRWRLLTTHFGFKKLAFDFCHKKQNMSQIEHGKLVQDFLDKKRALLRQSLPKMKSLCNLKISVPDLNPEVIFSMTRSISERVCTDSLKCFHLQIATIHADISDIKIEPLKIDGALQLVTKLTICDKGIYSFVLCPEELQNLSHLDLVYDLGYGDLWDPSRLADFKNFQKLQKMTLSFRTDNAEDEKDFFENFSFPPTLEELDLNLNFNWNEVDEENLTNAEFFDRVQQNGQDLKILNLILPYSTLYRNFAFRFIKQFPRLKKLQFQCEDEWEEDDDPELKLDIEPFWRALVPSKDTLHSISLCYPFITFSETIENFELRFPRLEKLKLSHNIIASAVLGPFLKSFPSLQNIYLSNVKFNEVSELEYFLNPWTFVGQKMTLQVYLDTEKIANEAVIDCLMKFLSEAKIRGNAEMHLFMNSKVSMDVKNELIKLIEKKFDKNFRGKISYRQIELFWGNNN